MAKKFLSSLPQQDPWLHRYYSWGKQSLPEKVSSCWVRRPLGLWIANKERSSRLDEKICHEIGLPEGQKALTIAPSFAVFGSVPEERLVNILNANIRFNCWRRQTFVRIHVLILVFLAKSPSFPQMWCDVISTLPRRTTDSRNIANCNMYRSAVSCVNGWLADALFHILCSWGSKEKTSCISLQKSKGNAIIGQWFVLDWAVESSRTPCRGVRAN